MYLGDIELARQLKEEVNISTYSLGLPLQNLNINKRAVLCKKESH
jgi:hypothetical protein